MRVMRLLLIVILLGFPLLEAVVLVRLRDRTLRSRKPMWATR